jgi:hypothetical protein
MSETLWISGDGGKLVAFIVDAEDFDLYASQPWHLAGAGMLYAKRRSTVAERNAGHGVRVKLHRLIAGATAGEFVDHIDGNKLDCRRSNLRRCTRGENNMNKGRLAKNNTSGERGVYRKINRWIVILRKDRKMHRGGSFVSFDEAVAEKRKLEARLYGDFATARLALNGVA